MFKENLIFGSNEDVIYLVLLWFLMNLTKHMDQFDWNEDMRLLDDKKVPQVSQFEEMTSRRGVKYGYDNSIQLYAGSLCSGSFIVSFRSFFRNSRAFSALTLDSRRLCINRTLLAFKAMHKRLRIRGGRSLARWVFKNYYTSKTTR